jgi:hypothetical protein
MKNRLKGEQLVAVSVLFIGLLNFPVISIVNVNQRIAGIPVLYGYVFSVWLFLVLLTAFILERRSNSPKK